jgi:uncharacterized cupredoxin-like copper-binding protein
MQKILIGAALVSALALAGCAGPGGSRTAPGPVTRAAAPAPGPFAPNGEASASSGKVSSQMTDTMKFGPNTFRAKAGQSVTVELKNAGSTVHNFIAPALGVAAPAKASGGQTVTATFTAPAAGTYEFWCNEPGHAEAGMVGQVIVD